jgi:Uma2 family endonuclease
MPAATLAPSKSKPASRVLTASEVADLPDTLNGNSVKYELYDGELVVMAPPSGMHGRRQNMIGIWLYWNAERIGLGKSFCEVGMILDRKQQTLLGPDAAFVLTPSLPVKFSREGYLTTIPEIVVEVLSKNDTAAEIDAKCDRYWAAGVIEVWIIDGDRERIEVRSSPSNVHSFEMNDMLTSKLLPGFSVPVQLIFN